MLKYFLLFTMALAALTGALGDELTDFGTALMNVVEHEVDIPYRLSGVAKIRKQGGTTIFSASLFNSDPEAQMIKPEDIIPKFQRLQIPGYSYRAVEVLTFAATFKIPPPAWRLQVKYTKI